MGGCYAIACLTADRRCGLLFTEPNPLGVLLKVCKLEETA